MGNKFECTFESVTDVLTYQFSARKIITFKKQPPKRQLYENTGPSIGACTSSSIWRDSQSATPPGKPTHDNDFALPLPLHYCDAELLTGICVT